MFSIVKTVEFKFPLVEYVIFFYYLQNVLCMVLLYLAFLSGTTVDMFQVCNVDILDFLPFVFLSVQSIYLGYILFIKRSTEWITFFSNIETLVPVNKIHILLIMGLIGQILSILGVSGLDYVAIVLQGFAICGLIILFVVPNYKYKKLLYILTIYQVLSALKTGLIGDSISLIFTIGMYLIIAKNIKKERVNWAVIFSLAMVALVFVAFLQNIKGEYRQKTWNGNEEQNLETFYNVAEEKKDIINPLSFDFYLGILYRLNHSGISSSTLNVVPYNIPFEDGATIIRSLVDAFVPRILNPDKETAGGREKYEKYTGRKLIGSTSMNIGIIGESYVNFGKNGAIALMFVFGVLIAIFENSLLKLSKNYPIILIFIPFYISIFIATENDFMIVFNSFVKGSFIIAIFIYYTNTKQKRGKTPLQLTVNS